VLVGTAKGVVRLQRAADAWRVVDRTLTELHVCALLKEPTSGRVFAGAHHGSVHISDDDGHTWRRSDTGLTQDDIYSLAAFRREDGSTRVYLGTEPAHLFYSDDLGGSWTELPSVRAVESVDKWRFPGPPHIAHLKHINVHPTDPKTIFASIEVGTLLKSRDEGQTWTELNVPYPDIHRCIVPPTNGDRLYVTGGDGLYVSSNGGGSWEHWTDRESATGGYPDQLVFHPANPDLMFMSAAWKSPGSWREHQTSNSRISRSHDGGRTWEQLTDARPASVEAMLLEAHGNTFTLIAATTAGEILTSEDGGDTWNTVIDDLAPISKGGHYQAFELSAV
jgi:photosystem II stability/assembly factor-like uncharacterized protein